MRHGPVQQEVGTLDPARRALVEAMSATVLGAYRAWRGERLRLGHGVVTNYRLILKGPGTIEIGDRANLFAFGVGRWTRLVARTPHAVIRIGENARLNAAELHADTLIEIGPDCIIGQAAILDTNMHSLALDRRTNPNAPVDTAPVILERNVWVGRGAAILAGVRLGEGSVVGFGSVVTSDVPPRVLVAGNPAKVIRSLG